MARCKECLHEFKATKTHRHFCSDDCYYSHEYPIYKKFKEGWIAWAPYGALTALLSPASATLPTIPVRVADLQQLETFGLLRSEHMGVLLHDTTWYLATQTGTYPTPIKGDGNHVR